MGDPLVSATEPEALVSALLARRQTVAIAESLTAGMASAAIGGMPGASEVMRGGLVVYATEAKASLAGVAEETLAQHGAVSAETAIELARGARKLLGADWGLGLTGVAGPDEQEGKPVGTAFVGIAGPGRESVLELSVPGPRWDVRVAVSRRAFAALVVEVDGQQV
ncbi:CinA family protein [Lolliginicoccus suaedae]|uniref:CinA family protein n=1 Tax=Lolliginicoccus suaedae TaxID=2605429 RepID=UPI0011EEDE02|nr:nicotinamide-nucleotide amidohydrolase family protein [Lolliginicoccus suaedae]